MQSFRAALLLAVSSALGGSCAESTGGELPGRDAGSSALDATGSRDGAADPDGAFLLDLGVREDRDAGPSPDAGRPSIDAGEDLPDGGGINNCEAITFGEPSCDYCMHQECCSESVECVSNTDCVALIQCLAACTDDTCFDRCFQQYLDGLDAFIALIDCEQLKCNALCGAPETNTVPIGGACNQDADCVTNLCSNQLWCTKACSTHADCDGGGASGENPYGRQNECDPISGFCFPTCSAQAHCRIYGPPGSGPAPTCREYQDQTLCTTGEEGTPVGG